jgi:hypothetical protein
LLRETKWGFPPAFIKGVYVDTLGKQTILLKHGVKSLFKSFSLEFLIYTGLVVGYFFLVLHFLGDWLNHLFRQERKIYAIVALALIVAQGLVLEGLTRALVFIVGKIKGKN